MKHIPYIEREFLYNAAIKKWGITPQLYVAIEPQLYVAIEEMSEVIKALTKFLRDPAHIEAAMPSIIEEVADATIMLEQLRLIFGINVEVCEAMDAKIERLKERVSHA